MSVCQTMFLNTLNISEKVMRTAVKKVVRVFDDDGSFERAICESVLE